jgi:hypothetical protein
MLTIDIECLQTALFNHYEKGQNIEINNTFMFLKDQKILFFREGFFIVSKVVSSFFFFFFFFNLLSINQNNFIINCLRKMGVFYGIVCMIMHTKEQLNF